MTAIRLVGGVGGDDNDSVLLLSVVPANIMG
jgi:hypothetical protein